MPISESQRIFRNQKALEYYHANKEVIAKRDKIRRSSPESKDKQKSYLAEWRAKRTPEQKVQAREYHREWYAKNRARTLENVRRYNIAKPDVNRRAKLKKFNITPEDWDRMFLAQGSRCALCRSAESGDRNFHVDHCHATGKVRGLLCHHCNTGLGLFRDSPELLQRAITYLS